MASTSRRTPGPKSSLKNLAVSSLDRSKASEAVADTWEEAVSSSSSRCTSPSPPYSPADATPDPPPPTPISSTHLHSRRKSTDWSTFASAYTPKFSGSTPRSIEALEKRPEKSSAPAGRLIAGALGIKPPKTTEEGKAYERAVREKERKRRETAKEEAEKAKREKEEAKRAIWEN